MLLYHKFHMLYTIKGNQLKINFRLHKKHTSISLRNDLVALWLLMNDHNHKEENSVQKAEEKVVQFVLVCLDSWPLNIARGFSDFVYQKIYEDILERQDFLKFQKIQKGLPK